MSFKSLICDAPAKLFVTLSKGHAGYDSCMKCEIYEKGPRTGDYSTQKPYFPDVDCTERTDDDYVN